jgi:hypothetical protein
MLCWCLSFDAGEVGQAFLPVRVGQECPTYCTFDSTHQVIPLHGERRRQGQSSVPNLRFAREDKIE